MKKLLSLIMVGLVLLTVGCGSKSSNYDSTKDTTLESAYKDVYTCLNCLGTVTKDEIGEVYHTDMGIDYTISNCCETIAMETYHFAFTEYKYDDKFAIYEHNEDKSCQVLNEFAVKSEFYGEEDKTFTKISDFKELKDAKLDFQDVCYSKSETPDKFYLKKPCNLCSKTGKEVGLMNCEELGLAEDFYCSDCFNKEVDALEAQKQLEASYKTCYSCGTKNAEVSYYDGIHGFFSAGDYCTGCYEVLYSGYTNAVAQEEARKHICGLCGETDGGLYPIEWYDGAGILESGYYHGLCYYHHLEHLDYHEVPPVEDYLPGTVYCPACGHETGMMGQEYLYQFNGETSCPQCGSTMKEH